MGWGGVGLLGWGGRGAGGLGGLGWGSWGGWGGAGVGLRVLLGWCGGAGMGWGVAAGMGWGGAELWGLGLGWGGGGWGGWGGAGGLNAEGFNYLDQNQTRYVYLYIRVSNENLWQTLHRGRASKAHVSLTFKSTIRYPEWFKFVVQARALLCGGPFAMHLVANRSKTGWFLHKGSHLFALCNLLQTLLPTRPDLYEEMPALHITLQ